jgi:hypothetical protein
MLQFFACKQGSMMSESSASKWMNVALRLLGYVDFRYYFYFLPTYVIMQVYIFLRLLCHFFHVCILYTFKRKIDFGIVMFDGVKSTFFLSVFIKRKKRAFCYYCAFHDTQEMVSAVADCFIYIYRQCIVGIVIKLRRKKVRLIRGFRECGERMWLEI